MVKARRTRRARIRRLGLLSALSVLAIATAAPAGAGSASAPNVPWEEFLPSLPTGANRVRGPQPGCAKATMACLDYEIGRMRAAQDHFGCDHRAVFATTYLTLTQVLRRTVARNPGYFADRRYLIYEDALFANYYFRTLDANAAGHSVPPAWQVAFDTAAHGDANAAQDMLLGINAHVRRDMPFVIATLGLHRPDGSSRKADHDRMNQILDEAYLPVVRAVARRYDQMVNMTNPGTPGDNLAGLELVKSWREDVWRDAERLRNARTTSERSAVESSIEQSAEASARSIAAIQTPPGYRAQRDAYCRKLGAGRGHPSVSTKTPRTSPPQTRRRPARRSHRRGVHRHRHGRRRSHRHGHRRGRTHSRRRADAG